MEACDLCGETGVDLSICPNCGRIMCIDCAYYSEAEEYEICELCYYED